MTEPAIGDRIDREALDALVAEADTGARAPSGLTLKLLFAVPLAWSLFQLWYASPLPFMLNFFILNDTQARSIHLAFAVFLAFLAFPAFKSSPRRWVPVQDWMFAVAGAFSAGYLYLFYRELSLRPGLPSTMDYVTAVIGLLLLLEAARRAVGPALVIIASIMIAYIFVGPYLPGMIAHKGSSIGRAMSQLWLTTEGVFGVALGVSTSFVFLFVLFGALLEKAGAGNYFIKLSFALLGHLRGGPAKAAVVSSGLTGIISGSSIANVVTTGTFTIPLMKRVGYPATKAGAVEAACSVNGQIMPPVMGAAAFLIAEYVGISYAEVVKHAFLPAIVTYLALFYIVDIEAVKLGLKGLPRARKLTGMAALWATVSTIAGIIIFSGAVYYGIGWTKTAFGAAATWILGAAISAFYVGLIAYRARFPDLEGDDPNVLVEHLPSFGDTARTGLHYLIPVVVLIWCLMVEALSPGLSAFYGTVALTLVVATQRPLTALFRAKGGVAQEFRHGLIDLSEGLVNGARNMIGVGLATAAAGIIVGTVSLTGIGLVMTEVVGYLSGGNLIVMLALTGVICLILGMGMPTTASYIIVATLMAPVIVELAAQNELAVPLVAVHLFVFYFGLMADVTPPVGLAAYAASAISGASPIATGVQAFRYEIRTALLPFIFIFNNELLMIGIDSVGHFVLVVGSSLGAMLLFVAATQNHFLVKNRWYESAALYLICFTLFRPGFWMDMIHPPFTDNDPAQIVALAEQGGDSGYLRLKVEAEDVHGKLVQKLVKLRIGSEGDGAKRLNDAGIAVVTKDGITTIDDVRFRSNAAKLGLDLDMRVLAVQMPSEGPPKHLMFLPALALLGLVVVNQRRRRPAVA
ncbi:MAG: TRAP transporter fused permease subunit [Azospirillum sp.]|nr:TRAP transporter fused permease subunit [Azospirillum sp.]